MKDKRTTPGLTPPREDQQLDSARIISIDPVIDDVIEKLKSSEPNTQATAIGAINSGKLHSNFLIDPLIEVAFRDMKSIAPKDREVASTNADLADHLLSDYGSSALNAMTRALPNRDIHQQSLIMAGIYHILTNDQDAKLNYSSTAIIADEALRASEEASTPLVDHLLMNVTTILEFLKKHPDKVVQDCPIEADPMAQAAFLRIAERLTGKE